MKLIHQSTNETEIWLILVVIGTTFIAVLLKAVFPSLISKSNSKLPPGPYGIPILSNILWLRKSSPEREATLREIYSKFGPIVTLPIGIKSRPLILISSRLLAYQALVQNGAIFADRPKALPTAKIMSSNQHDIASAGYGSIWRTLRRNLTSQFLRHSHVKDFSHARKWVLDILLGRLRGSFESDAEAIKVMDHFRFSMFSLLLFMCFGNLLDEEKIREIEYVQRQVLRSVGRFQILDLWPRLSRIIFRRLWNELYSLKKQQEDVLVPHIRAVKQSNSSEIVENTRLATCYVDKLLDLEISEDDRNDSVKRKLNEAEIVTACSEFLNAGTDTTSTALEWIMANLVKHPEIQAKLFEEIKGIIGEKAKIVEEDELSKMHYLKAVVLEGLRRHPPAHFVLPHAVTQEVQLAGHTIQQNAVINFAVAEMGWDPNVWEDPMQFKPERFMSDDEDEFDITGSREIKMMPFGVGRRICPGFGLAMHHLEYFVANLVWHFEWSSVGEVDLYEKQEFTIVMKQSLCAQISPRLVK